MAPLNLPETIIIILLLATTFKVSGYNNGVLQIAYS